MTRDSDKAETMRIERFRELLDAYGANPARWPQAERAGALALVATSAEARSLRDAEAAFDVLIDFADTAPVTAQLEARILATLPQTRTRAGLPKFLAGLWPGRSAWVPASALALSLALGLAVGTFVPSLMGLANPHDQDLALVALGEPDVGVFDDMGEGS